MNRRLLITVQATVFQSSRPFYLTIITYSYILYISRINNGNMVANSTCIRSILFSLPVNNGFHPANQFRTMTVQCQNIGLMR